MTTASAAAAVIWLLVQRVIFRKVRKYSDIALVDVSATDTDNLDIACAGSPSRSARS